MKTFVLLLGAVLGAAAPVLPATAGFIFSDSPLSPRDAATFAGAGTDPAQASYRRGLDALRAGDIDAAERAFKSAAQINPRMPQPLVGLADVAQKRGNPEQAGELLRQALTVAPTDEDAGYALAVHHTNTKDYAAAEAQLKLIVELNPRHTAAQLDLANLYANALDRPNDAIATYRAILSADDKHAGAHYGLAMALARADQFKEAEAGFRAAARLAPGTALPLHSLARLQLSRGQTQAATASLDQALKVQPDFVPALLDKGDVLMRAGQLDAALALFERATAADERNPTAHFKRGTVLQMQKRHVEARQAYVTVISLDNGFAPAYNNLAWMQTESRDNLEQGSQWAATAVELAPENPAFRDTQGWVYRTQRKLAQAEAVLVQAATMQPPSADIQYHLGMVYLDQKKPDEARRAFDAALAIDPQHAPSKAALQGLSATANR